MSPDIDIIEYPTLCDYTDTWKAMQRFTEERDEHTKDQIWCLQHHPVFTLGQAGKPEHILQRSSIPIVESDRGGQVTYHGPGQIIVYVLLDLRRRSLGVRHLVTELEATVVEWLAGHGITAVARKDAPGVYVNEAKIAALGLRVRRGCSFHGLSVNVDLDLKPFNDINPCGYVGMEVTQVKEHRIMVEPAQVGSEMANILVSRLSSINSI